MGLFGLMLGALIFGPLADRIGRKNVITLSVFIFGIFTLLTVTAESINQLIMYRFLTGLGLGGAMPNIISLTSEYSPKRIRSTMVAVMFIGLPLGGVLGGFLSARMISSSGWQSLFYLGGSLPILLAIVLLFVLPESIRFLVAKGTQSDKVAASLNKIDPSEKLDSSVSFYLPEEKAEGFTVKHLFGPERTRNTLLLWVVFFMNLLMMYFLINWLPAVLKAAKFSTERAIISSTMMHLGGIFGGIVVSRLGDKLNPRAVLKWFYLLAAVSVALIGLVGNQILLMIVIFLSGFSVVGSQFIINGLAASIYPTAVRSTGVGWALGIGRIGSIIGPVVGGMIIALKWSNTSIFLTGAIPAIFAALAVVFMTAQGPKEVTKEGNRIGFN
jgi:AAHS family 4-hydroxybenzoate transporter-like MFS transporter